MTRYPTDHEIMLAADMVGEKSFNEIKRLILLTRAAEAEGFSHGGEEWSGNMEEDEIESDSPIYNYKNRLLGQMEKYEVR